MIKQLPIYISVFLLALVLISIFFFKRTNESVDLISTDGSITKKNNRVDSIRVVNEPKPESGNQQKSTPDIKTPERKLAVDQNSKREKPQEDFEETNLTSKNEPDAAETKPGAIFISTYPWAKIYINGEYQETTPLKEPLQLEAGKHELKLENPNFASIEKVIVIRAELTDTLNFNLEPAFGFLEIQVIPWAEIYINDEYEETTPLNDPISLPAGKHELKLVNPNFSTWVDSIKIEPGQTFKKRISLLKSG